MVKEKITLKNAVLINAASRYLNIVLNVLIGAVLARLINPEDYGTMAIITVFTTLFMTISDLGLSTAIVQNKTLDGNDINSIYSFSVYISLFIAVIFCFLANVLVLFYGINELLSLSRWLSVSLFFSSANMVPNGILNRDKRFAEMAVRNVLVCIISAIVTIVVALNGAGIIALIIQSTMLSILNFFWSIILTKLRFSYKFTINSIKKIASYSGYQYAFSILNYFARNLDNLLAGKYIGALELAFYNRAYNLMLYPINNITGVVSPVLHPIMSDYQDDKEYIYCNYIKILKCLMIISIFVEIYCIYAATDIIGLMYGEKWYDSVACFKILSIAIITQMVTGTTGSIFQALGETRLLFKAGSVNIAITLMCTIVAIVTGNSIEYLALLVAISYLAHFFISFYVMMKYGFKRSYLKFLLEFRSEIISFLILLIFGYLFPNIQYSCAVNLFIKGCYLGAIYALYLLFSGNYRYFKILRRKREHEKNC